MLKELRIENLILVEKASLLFTKGLNVLSGETGAGKSAIMEALHLLLGGRADTQVIRKGAEKGVIEAIFIIEHLPELKKHLNEWGIDHVEGEDLILKREVSHSSSSRVFINHQLAQVSLLKKVGDFLMEIVAQHATQRLLSLESHLSLLDLYGDLKEEAHLFKKSWEEETNYRKQLQEFKEQESFRLREIDMCKRELEELEAASLKEGEDEQLFEEYSLQVHAEERKSRIASIIELFSGEKTPILASLKKCQLNLQHLSTIDASLNEQTELLKNATLELEEIHHSLRIYQGQIECDPHKMEKMNERLTLINKLKKKYGSSLEDINKYQDNARLKLELLENADQKIEALQKALESLEKANQIKAEQLSKKRKAKAQSLEKALTQELRDLNMPKSEFQIEVTSCKRNFNGEDHVQFFLIPNPGEHRVPIKSCASGGELSRVMLALQVLLAGKELLASLVFDEIDANIGGATASIVGQKLKSIGKAHQVICITHFPQVAQYADHHIRIQKEVKSGRTFTLVEALDESTRQDELLRMQGIMK